MKEKRSQKRREKETETDKVCWGYVLYVMIMCYNNYCEQETLD
jgi:hypothetical protein